VLNKPVGVITTLDDPSGRRSVAELPAARRARLPGREARCRHQRPAAAHQRRRAGAQAHAPALWRAKVYRVRLAPSRAGPAAAGSAQGVRFDTSLVSGPARVRRIDPGFDAIMIEIVVHEGRFRRCGRCARRWGSR
jgi:23S rRNA pseudouridine2605 synthase